MQEYSDAIKHDSERWRILRRINPDVIYGSLYHEQLRTDSINKDGIRSKAEVTNAIQTLAAIDPYMKTCMLCALKYDKDYVNDTGICYDCASIKEYID